MPAQKIDKFGGMLPAWDDTLLPDGQAALCRNTYLYSGAAGGWRKPRLLRNLTNPDARFAYRVPKVGTENHLADTSITASDAVWLEFEDQETDVMRSPSVNDTHGRYYFASPSVQPKYNTYARIRNGDAAFLLGVPAPLCPPTVEVTGGTESETLGNETATSSAIITPGGNTILLIKIQPVNSEALNSVSFMPASTSTTARFAAVVYTDRSGAPDTLMNTGVIGTGTTAGAESASIFVNPVTLDAQSVYWIGVMLEEQIGVHVANDNAGTGFVSSNTFSNGPPVVISNGSGGQSNWQIWGDLSTGAVFAARAYVYTWVSVYDEEGPPSTPTLVNGWSNGTWTIGLYAPPASDQGVDRNLDRKRIYRTISSQGGETTYFFVAEVPINDATYTDIIQDDVVAINDQLVSTDWFPPPEDMKGILSMPNGLACGWRENELWFCEPFQPHAWPSRYVQTVEYPIVGLGLIGQTVVIVTQGQPYVATGVDPTQITVVKVDIKEPALSRRSIVNTDTGVMYCSRNGLIQVTQHGTAANVTELWITRERWAELVPFGNICAIKLASSYFAFGTVSGTDNSLSQQGFTLELSNSDKESFTIIPQPGGHRLGFNPMTAPNELDIYNVILDPWTGIGMLIQGGKIYYYDFGDADAEFMPFLWRSKVFQARSKHNFTVVRTFFDVPSTAPELSAERNTDNVQVLADDQYLILRVYASVGTEPGETMTLVTTREVRKSGELLRIKSGFKSEFWQFELEGRVEVSNFQVATTVKELAGV